MTISPDLERRSQVSRFAVLSATVTFEGGLIVVAVLVGPLVGIRPLTLIEWDVAALGWGLVLAGVAFALVFWGIEINVPFLRRTTQAVEEVVNRLFAHCKTTDLLIVSVFAGFGEELLFRGVMQQALASATGWGVALVLTSLLFGLAHFVSMSYFWYATGFGLAAGSLFLLTDNLLAAIIAHAAYDFVALVFLVRRHRRHVLYSS